MQVFLDTRNSCSLNVGLGLRFCSYIFPSIFRRYPLCESPPSFYKQGFICIFYLLLKRVSCRVNGLKDTCVGSRVTHERFLNCRRTENRPILHSSSSVSHPSQESSPVRWFITNCFRLAQRKYFHNSLTKPKAAKTACRRPNRTEPNRTENQ